MSAPGIGQRWAEVATSLGADGALAAASGVQLAELYDQPPRWYHSAGHACRVADAASELAAHLPVGDFERQVLTAAALAHDVIYEGRAGADEEASADTASRLLADAGVSKAVAAEVARLIRTTATHRVPPEDHVAAALSDADLSILGADPVSYDGYVRAVRKEYAHVSDALWTAGRSAVLADLLDRPDLFLTAPAKQRWDRQARQNLTAELGSLRGTD